MLMNFFAVYILYIFGSEIEYRYRVHKKNPKHVGFYALFPDLPFIQIVSESFRFFPEF